MATKKKAKSRATTAKKKSSRPAAKKAAARPARASGQPSPKQRFLDTFTKEHKTTVKVLRAFPAEQGAFRPHPRSNAASDLAFTFVMEQALITKAILGQPFFGGTRQEKPESFTAILDQFEEEFEDLSELIRKTPEASFNKTLQFPSGPNQMGTFTVMEFAWFMLMDQIHHRGQLSTYLRMAGGKVPSIYGPSADEPWR